MIKKKYGKMFAVHCNSIALPHAKHCIAARKPLHCRTQSFAWSHAKHCMVSREPLHVMCEEK